MAGAKWIKVYTNMISNKKIKKIRRLPEGNNIILIWVFLLAQAGECNKDGGLFITDTIPFTVDDLADEFDFRCEIIRLALSVLERFQMIEVFDDVIFIKNWHEYQNIEGLDKIREQTRLRVARHREKTKLLESGSVISNVTVTQSNEIEKEKELEIDIEKDIDIEKEIIPWKKLLIAYNDLPIKDIRTITDKRKTKVKARMNSLKLTFNDVIEAVNNIKSSSFLLGKNNRNWVIDFDWLFENDNNFTKVFEGKYTDKGVNNGTGINNQKSKESSETSSKLQEFTANASMPDMQGNNLDVEY